MKDFSQKKTRILKRVVAGRLSKSEGARRLGVSRTTIYRWLDEFEKRKTEALAKKEKKRSLFKKDILRIVVARPKFGPKRISKALAKKGKKISPKSVWLVLKDLGLGTREKREDYSYDFQDQEQVEDASFPKRLRLTPEARKRMVEQVALGDKGVSEICREYHVARKTFYKWYKRYL